MQNALIIAAEEAHNPLFPPVYDIVWSALAFVIIFLVAFIFVRFLGANVVEQSGATGKGKK